MPFLEFTRATLPAATGFEDQQVLVIEGDGTRTLLLSDGKRWVGQGGAIQGSTGLSALAYDGSNRVTAFSFQGANYTVTYSSNAIVVSGGPQTFTVALDGAGRISGVTSP